MPEFFRHAVRNEFKVQGEENVICNLLRYSFPKSIEGIRDY